MIAFCKITEITADTHFSEAQIIFPCGLLQLFNRYLLTSIGYCGSCRKRIAIFFKSLTSIPLVYSL